MNDRDHEIASIPKYKEYQRGLASMVYKFFDKKTESGESVNEELAQELVKTVTKNSKQEKCVRGLKIIFGRQADLAKMESLSSFNRGVKYVSCVIESFTKYAWVKPLKDKKAKTVLHGFIETEN